MSRFVPVVLGTALLAVIGLSVPCTFAQPPSEKPDQQTTDAALPPDLLEAVPPRGTAWPPQEREAFYEVLARTRDADPALLEAVARRNIRHRLAEVPDLGDADQEFSFYFDMLRFPERYQGKLLTFEGRIGRLVERPADENEHGIETLYEAWLYTPDSGHSPIVVVCTSVPEGMPTGEHLVEQARVTGYFFMISPWSAAEPERFAPLMLARQLGWQRDSGSTPGRIDPALIAPVRHLTRGVRDAERDAYYRILKHAAETDYAAQQAAARENIRQRTEELTRHPDAGRKPELFIDFFRHPDWHGRPAPPRGTGETISLAKIATGDWSGQAVTLSGHVRQWQKIQEGANEYGVGALYELWLYPPDTQSNPVVVVCTELPDDLPRIQSRQDVIDHVTVTGYFFKLYHYTADDVSRLAPMVLAQRVEWHPVEPAGIPFEVQAAVGGALMLVLAAAVWYVYRSSRKDREFRRKRQAATNLPELPAFDPSQVPDGIGLGIPESDEPDRSSTEPRSS